jgi:hypothetical protein
VDAKQRGQERRGHLAGELNQRGSPLGGAVDPEAFEASPERERSDRPSGGGTGKQPALGEV